MMSCSVILTPALGTGIDIAALITAVVDAIIRCNNKPEEDQILSEDVFMGIAADRT